MRLIALPFLFALAACAHASVEPVVQTVEIKVPVPVPCRIHVGKPKFAADHSNLNENIDNQAKTLLVDREQRKAYERKLEAGVKGCNS
jgi:hypothetical protein